MAYNEKIEFMFEDLGQKGLPKLLYAPFIYRFFWKLGLSITPPLFASFIKLLFFYFWVFLVVYMFISLGFSLLFGPRITITSLAVSILGALIFALWMAFFYRLKSKKLNLPSWNEYRVHTHSL